RVQVEKATGRLSCFDRANRPFAADTDLGLGWQFGRHPARICAWKRIEADEHYYGFGERTGGLDKLSHTMTNWTVDSLDYTGLTDAMYQAIPFFMALRPEVGYGLFLNCTDWSSFDIGTEQTGIWQMQSHSRELDYYVIYGPEPAQILETYTALTGRMPLPPHWALGYHQCRWSYRSEAEVRELAAQFRQRQIPCDVIHLDIDYMDGFRVFTWNPQRFPDPKQLLSDLSQDGFQVVTIVDPGVKFQPDDPYPVLESGLQQNCFVRHADGRIFHGYVWPDRAVFPDFMRPDVRQWWSQQHRALTDAGVAGIWNDMNEPALNDRPFGDPGDKIPFPLDAPQGDEAERTNHAETHNLYGQMMARAAAEALQTLRPQQRSFVLTRSGFAGIQRWSAVWTGDNHSRWEYLEMSLPMLCNLGLSGVAFVGADIGGFAGNATAELFARWMQVGMLYPLMRAHTANTSMQHEPWVFGERVEQICRSYIELRYQLLPYLYTLFWQAANTGAPILRPLLYEFPADRAVTQLADQVMLGPAILAAPILRPGAETRAVYLPQGTWFDWWTGEQFQGPTHILASAPLETMPLYVRAGSILPMAPVRQHTGEPLDHLRLKIWPGEGEWLHYEDDGSSFDYQQGAWTTTRYRVTTAGQTVTVSLEAHSGDRWPQPRQLIVEVVGLGEQTVTDDGTARRLVFELAGSGVS
ncbi:MAG: TIM-barrel domain-containing protein, partial [Elainella sp.]